MHIQKYKNYYYKIVSNIRGFIFSVVFKSIKIGFFVFLIIFFSSIIFRIYKFHFYNKKPIKNHSKFEKNIAIDATLLMGKGGISFLTKFVIINIAKRQPYWRFILLSSQNTSDFFDDLIAPNIEIQKVRTCYFAPFVYIFKILNFLTLKNFNNELIQFFFFDRKVVDKSCDIILYPEAHIDYLDFDCKKVITIHDLIAKELPENVSYDAEYVFDCILRQAKSASKIITVSDFSKHKIMQYMDIDEQRIKVIPIEIEIENLDSLKGEEALFLNKYNLCTRKYLIYISAFWRHKNHLNLLRAFSHISKKFADIKLVLVGSHMQISKHVYYLLVHLGIKDKVVFTDYISENEKYFLLKNAKALIHPSLYEGFGIPVVEAMSLGVPVICSNVGSLAEVSQNAAKMFNPYDENEIFKAVFEVLNDEILQKKLKEAGLRRAENFSNPSRMISSYIEVFNGV